MDAVSQHGGRARPLARNWAFLFGLGICSLAVAGLGIFGWAFSDAPTPLIVCAAAFCVAAQFVAACCGANFGRHTWRAAAATRAFLLLGYLAAATFAAYSADQGWMAATAGPHRAAAAARANERGRAEAEIAEREGYVRMAEQQRAAVIAPGPLLTAQLQAPYSETIRRNEARLRELRADLESKPALPIERERNALDWAALLAFVFWQALEPWLYHAVERGRRPTALETRPAGWSPRVVEGGRDALPPAHAPPSRPLQLTRLVGWRPLLAGLFGWWAVSNQQIPPPSPPTSASPSEPAPPIEPIIRVVELGEVIDLRAAAAQLAAQNVSERRIAAQLAITRWQVRKLLGRVAA